MLPSEGCRGTGHTRGAAQDRALAKTSATTEQHRMSAAFGPATKCGEAIQATDRRRHLRGFACESLSTSNRAFPASFHSVDGGFLLSALSLQVRS